MAERIDPYKNLRFRLEIGGREVAGFMVMDGPDADAAPVRAPHAARVRPAAVALKRGVAVGPELAHWWRAARSGDASPVDVVVRMTNEEGTETVARWEFRGARPTRFYTAGYIGEDEWAFEKLELVFDSVHNVDAAPAGSAGG
jgi:phage tail-like protein